MAEFTRRRLLLTGAAGLTSSLAGCDGVDTNPERNTPPEDDDINTPARARNRDNDGDAENMPSSPAAEFHYKENSKTFPFEDIHEYRGFEEVKSAAAAFFQPDNRIFRANVTSSEITVTLESGRINRAIEVFVEFNTASGDVASTDTKTVSPTDDFQTHELTFDIRGQSLPELSPGLAYVIGRDTFSGDTPDRILKAHRHLAIPYDNADGGGVHYLNSEAGLNHQMYYAHDRSTFSTMPPEGQARHEIRTTQDNTIFLATVLGDNAVGGAFTVKHSTLNRYGDYYSRPDDLIPPTVIYNAPDIDRLSSFAAQIGESMANAGITNQFAKLNALATMVQTIPYQTAGHGGNSPLYTINENVANCTERSFIYMALANCPPFNTRTVTIACDLGELDLHQVVGIDERDLGNPPNPENIYYVEDGDGTAIPDSGQDCIPNDRRYAFLELTSNSRIGRYSENVYEILGIRDTSNLDCSPQYR